MKTEILSEGNLCTWVAPKCSLAGSHHATLTIATEAQTLLLEPPLISLTKPVLSELRELCVRVIHRLHPEALLCGKSPPKPRAMSQIRCLNASGSCLLSEEVLIQPDECSSEKQEGLEGRALDWNLLTNSCRAD